jgi:hypothetical protein
MTPTTHVRYRVALVERVNITGKQYYTVLAVSSDTSAKELEELPEFCRWLTNWIETPIYLTELS